MMTYLLAPIRTDNRVLKIVHNRNDSFTYVDSDDESDNGINYAICVLYFINAEND